jgi:hypothetical protein
LHSVSVYALSSKPVSHFSFLDCRYAIGEHDEDDAIWSFPADAVQFEEVKASQSDGCRCFKLNLCTGMTVSLMALK